LPASENLHNTCTITGIADAQGLLAAWCRQLKVESAAARRSVVPERRQHSVDESRKLCLMVCAGLGEGLLELGPRRGRSDPHGLGGHLQTMTAGDGYCHLRLSMGQTESLPQ
jgi:hypothetical protein